MEFYPRAAELTTLNQTSTSIGDAILFNDICSQFDHLMAESGKTLPPQWSLPEFTRAVIGEEAVQDLPYLSDVLSDLLLHGSQSWHWEGASQLLTLITSSGIL